MKRSRQHDARDGWYFVTPSEAQALLESQPQNRPLRVAKAQRFADLMMSGGWQSNGEPIILDERNHILDGQGRLSAVVIANKTVEFYVIHNIGRVNFPTIDTGQSRGGSDTLALMGFSNYSIAAAICSLGIRAKDPSYKRAVPNSEILEFARKNEKEINEAINVVLPYKHTCPVPPSIVAYVYMIAAQVDKERALEFSMGVLTGEGLPNASPMLYLRNRMIALSGRSHSLNQSEKLALTIKAWNFFYKGVAPKSFRLQKTKTLDNGQKIRREVMPAFAR